MATFRPMKKDFRLFEKKFEKFEVKTCLVIFTIYMTFVEFWVSILALNATKKLLTRLPVTFYMLKAFFKRGHVEPSI